MKGRYSFDLLFKHSGEVAISTRKDLKKEISIARSIFNALDRHFSSLEMKPKSLNNNVKLALTARFTNHLFSALLLTERGLILDASNCTRSALETTAFYWLVCLKPETAKLYDAERSPRPVEIRKQLEKLGVDVQPLKDLYGIESDIAHVGNYFDNFQIRWEGGKSGKLLVGGGKNLAAQKYILDGLPQSIFRFFLHDKDYVIERSEI